MPLVTLCDAFSIFPWRPPLYDVGQRVIATMWTRFVILAHFVFQAQMLYAAGTVNDIKSSQLSLTSRPSLADSTTVVPSATPSTAGSSSAHETISSSAFSAAQSSTTTNTETSTPAANLTTSLPTSSGNITTSLPVPTSSSSVNASSTSTSPAQPSQTIDPATLQDIETIASRRLVSIIGSITTSTKTISTWISTLGPDGSWPDVDYTTGCAAQRANWPAEAHWNRILPMSAAWYGGLPNDQAFMGDPSLRATLSSAMGYWFGRDFTNIACLDGGGTPACPCTNPDNSLWNTNWFSNIIGIPELVSQTCLLLNDTLLPTELSNCTNISGRAYATFGRTIIGLGTLTGANTLDVAKIGIDQALLTINASLITDAYQRVDAELQIKNGIMNDGIRADGSFGQHGGIIYNGNYGKDYSNDLLDLELEAGGTQFEATTDSQNAFNTLFTGDAWMIVHNSITGVLHWDFSVLGRFISFPVIDNQATGSIDMNLTKVHQLGEQWSSETLINFANSLSTNTTNANAGNLQGNRMFYANDYMVHRGKNYVTTVRMYSTRTRNTECVNSENPLGFHLSDGAVYTYLAGNEYEDIAAAWDWNLIPGITVDYGATQLACGTTGQTGVQSFVGGVSDGKVGVAVMAFTNPISNAFSFQKAWFFLENDVQVVMIPVISSSTNATVISVLDQKRHNGEVIIDENENAEPYMTGATVQTLWHDNVGYDLTGVNSSATLTAQTGVKSGDWSVIGISKQPPAVVDFFTAYLEHGDLTSPISYVVYPGASLLEFQTQSLINRQTIQVIENDGNASAVLDEINQVAMFVFWQPTGGSVTFKPGPFLASITITSNANLVVMFRTVTGEVTVSDPSQTLSSAEVSFCANVGRKLSLWGPIATRTLFFDLPAGGLAGSSVTQSLYY